MSYISINALMQKYCKCTTFFWFDFGFLSITFYEFKLLYKCLNIVTCTRNNLIVYFRNSTRTELNFSLVGQKQSAFRRGNSQRLWTFLHIILKNKWLNKSLIQGPTFIFDPCLFYWHLCLTLSVFFLVI